MIRKYSLVGFGFLACLCIAASAEEWRFSLGVNYRTFDDIDYKATGFTNATTPAFTDYINGSIVSNGAGETITVVDGGAQAPSNLPGGVALDGPGDVKPSSSIFLDRISFAKSSEDVDAAFGIVLGASRVLEDGADVRWDLDWTLTTATSSDDELFTIAGTTDTVTAFDSIGVSNGNPAQPDTQVDASSTVVSSTTGGSLFSTGTLDFDYDLDIYTIGVGVSSNWVGENFSWSVGVGPTLTVGDFDVSVTQTSATGAASSSVAPGTVLSSQTRSDGDDDFIFGVYTNLGAKYDVSDTVAVSLEYRYDFAFSDLSTSLADVELDGSSLLLRAIFSY